MKALKKLFNTKTKVLVGIAIALILLTWIVLFFTARDTALKLIEPLLWSFLFVAVAWLAIHFGVQAWKKRKRAEFDEKVAAKEGIEDRRREWSQWTEELEKQGIDRYELPFYLLVGEPQSGKSVLLHNSDLHFPFGQNRLSGVGGTRGCDWWFTEEAVILDLAGRLFTHEGGAADRVEYEAFLEMLSEFRPLCPANGVLLVVPCDSLLTDDEEQCALKATKIQNALLTLTSKLEAQLPVYLVLTKGDQVFGFAESVHRLDVERRHEMFGWSRPAEKIDSPFDLREVTEGFDEMVSRARLLRAHMAAGARLPEALPEIDRMVAFPHELEGMRGNLEVYLKRIFTSSNITDRIFFRGLYLTSGLQSGVPIAKVCSELFGATGEADTRNLEALFSKPKAYFIKDLVQTRVFGERGLVRPTQGRVKQSKRASMMGYGFAGAVTLISVVFGAAHLLKDKDSDRSRVYTEALEMASESVAEQPEKARDVLDALHLLSDAAMQDEDAAEKAFQDPREDLKELYCSLFDVRLVPLLKQEAMTTIEKSLDRGFNDHDQLRRSCDALLELSKQLDLRKKDARESITKLLPTLSSVVRTVAGTEPLTLEKAFDLRLDWGPGENTGLFTTKQRGEDEYFRTLAIKALGEIEQSLTPGSVTQPAGEFGYMLAWYGAESAYKALRNPEVASSGQALALSAQFSRSYDKLEELEGQVGSAKAGGRNLEYQAIHKRAFALQDLWRHFKALELGEGVEADQLPWPEFIDFASFNLAKFESHSNGGWSLSDFGLQFGSADASQTVFVQSEKLIGQVQASFIVGSGGDYNPTSDFKEERGLLGVSKDRLAADPNRLELAGLGSAIEKVHKRTLSDMTGGAAARAFAGQISEARELFESQYGVAREAVLAVGGEEALGMGLSVSTVRELVELHRSLQAVRAERLTGTAKDHALEWQALVEALLHTHLHATTQSRDLSWVPEVTSNGADPEVWEVLGALGSVANLELVPRGTPAVETAASVLQSRVFFSVAEDLLDEWRKRPGDLAAMTAITGQLRDLTIKVSTMPNAAGLNTRDLGSWSQGLDSQLETRLGQVRDTLALIWQPALSDGNFLTVLDETLRHLGEIEDKIQQSGESGMAGLSTVADDLRGLGDGEAWIQLPNSTSLISSLDEWLVPSQVNQVTRQEEYKAFDAALRNVKEVSLAGGGGEALATSYSRFFRRPATDTPAANAGVRLVRSLRTQFAEVLKEEVRLQYESELADLLEGNKYRYLFDVLFYTPGSEDEESIRFKDIERKLDDFFRRKGGDFDKLRKSYALADRKNEKGIEEDLYPPLTGDEDEEEEAWSLVHRFLMDLREFMLGDEDHFGGAELTFELSPGLPNGNVWDLEGIEFAARRTTFWYPKGGKGGELSRAFLGDALDRVSVSSWSLEEGKRGRKFQLFWSTRSTQAEVKSDPEAYSFEIQGALGPLLMAWMGRPLNEENGRAEEFEVLIKPKGTVLDAPLEILFETPLPLRPERP